MELAVKYGGTQGTGLGPILFALYLKDIYTTIYKKIELFANVE